MNQDLRDRFEARDAFGIVSSQVADGALPLMCESYTTPWCCRKRPNRWVRHEGRRSLSLNQSDEGQVPAVTGAVPDSVGRRALCRLYSRTVRYTMKTSNNVNRSSPHE
jgi:hypothetical protein